MTVGKFNTNNVTNSTDIILIGTEYITKYSLFPDGHQKEILYSFPKTSTVSARANIQQDYRWYQIKLHDVNCDGLMDVLFINGRQKYQIGSNTSQTGVQWLPQLSSGMLEPVSTSYVAVNVRAPRTFAVVDMNDDNIQDVVVYSSSDDTIYLSSGV
jgi:hypothetical protein